MEHEFQKKIFGYNLISEQDLWITSSMVEHLAYNEKVSGSNPLLSIT